MDIIATDRNGIEFTVGDYVNYGAPRNARVIGIKPKGAIGSDGKPLFTVELDLGHDSYSFWNNYRLNRHLRKVAA